MGVTVLGLACVGQVGPNGGPVDPGNTGPGPGPGNPPGTSPGMMALVPGRAPLRRLTRVEYDNTVRALLGDTSRPALQFEGDVISDGFTNNADTQNVGTNLAQQYVTAAEALSITATRDMPKLLGCDLAAAETACMRDFITRFGQRAWRRPLVAAEIDRLVTVFTTGKTDFDVATGTQMVLQTILLSPNFLYRVELGRAPAGQQATTVPLTSWEMASRLSYFLMGSMPDDVLFAAADKDALATPAEVAEQARRLLSATGAGLPQEMAQSRYAQFFTEWLHLVNIDKMTKDRTLFPEFSTDLALALKTETETFVKKTLFGGPGDLTTLLTAPYTYATPEVARLYGVTVTPGATPARIDLDPNRRAGLLTQPALLATFSKADYPDPVHRGKFIWEGLLCGTVPPPPMNANITPPKITPGTTARQRFEEHRADPTCATCHTVMDPIGLALENYDGLGRWRDTEGPLPIDASGNLTGTDVDGKFVGGVELAKKLAGSQQVAACAVRQLFRFAFGRFETPEDEPTVTDLASRFEGDKRKLVGLSVAITQTPAFRLLKVGP